MTRDISQLHDIQTIRKILTLICILSLTVIMEGVILTRNPPQEDVNFLGNDWSLGNARSNTQFSLSTVEAEYVVAVACCSQVLWIQHQLEDYGLKFNKTPIYCDNSTAVQIVKNRIQHSKTKHIDIKIHFIRDYVDKQLVYLEQIHCWCRFCDNSLIV